MTAAAPAGEPNAVHSDLRYPACSSAQPSYIRQEASGDPSTTAVLPPARAGTSPASETEKTVSCGVVRSQSAIAERLVVLQSR